MLQNFFRKKTAVSENSREIAQPQRILRETAEEIRLAFEQAREVLQALFGCGRCGQQKIDPIGNRGGKMRGEIRHFAMRASVVLKFESVKTVQASASRSWIASPGRMVPATSTEA